MKLQGYSFNDIANDLAPFAGRTHKVRQGNLEQNFSLPAYYSKEAI